MRGSHQTWSWPLPQGPQRHLEPLPPSPPVRRLLLPIWIPIPLPGPRFRLPWHYLGHLRFVFCLEPFYLSLRLVVGHGPAFASEATARQAMASLSLLPANRRFTFIVVVVFNPPWLTRGRNCFFQIPVTPKIKRRRVLLRVVEGLLPVSPCVPRGPAPVDWPACSRARLIS